MPPAEPGPALSQALALGLLQGPAELLPVSSSAHTSLLPWLLGWRYDELDGPRRKSFEVALHAGAGVALALAKGGSLRRDGERLLVRPRTSLALAIGPPALAGLLLREPIERHGGGPRSIAGGLLAGAVAMALADGTGDGKRRRERAGPRDGLALGLAQALALMPGVSRNGATLACARARGFSRDDSDALSWIVGLPVLLGASGLEAGRMLSGRRTLELPALAGGAGASFASTWVSARLLGRRTRSGRLLGFSIYRCLLAAVVFVRRRRAQ
jgi:undecaprenyl-diphosphatase